MVKLKIDARDFTKGRQKFAKMEKDIPKHVADSINKSLDVGKPQAEGAIASRYNVGNVSLKVNKASAGKLQGSLEGTGGMKRVEEFNPSMAYDPYGHQIVSVSIKAGSRNPILPSSRGLGFGAFMTHDGRVMERRQDARYPIFPVMTIGIPQMLGSKAVSNPVRDTMGNTVTKELTAKLMKL
jgi:hypothetical protein